MRQFLVHIGELPSKEGNCTVFIEEDETDNACQGVSSLVAAQTTRKDYEYEAPEQYKLATLGYQVGCVCGTYNYNNYKEY